MIVVLLLPIMKRYSNPIEYATSFEDGEIAGRMAALAFCLVAQYLCPAEEGRASKALVALVQEMSHESCIVPVILVETLLGLDEIREEGPSTVSPFTHRGGCGLALSIWLMERLALVEPPRGPKAHGPGGFPSRIPGDLLKESTEDIMKYLAQLDGNTIRWFVLWWGTRVAPTYPSRRSFLLLPGFTRGTFFCHQILYRQTGCDQVIPARWDDGYCTDKLSSSFLKLAEADWTAFYSSFKNMGRQRVPSHSHHRLNVPYLNWLQKKVAKQ